MKIQVTKNKSATQTGLSAANSVQVFVNSDFNHGYWINEQFLVETLLGLKDSALAEYLATNDYSTSVDVATAKLIVDNGATPFSKPKLT